MSTHHLSADIDASAQRVFEYLTDPDLATTWAHGSITHDRLTPERRVGSRSRITHESGAYRREMEQEIVGLDRDRLVEVRGRCRITNQGRELPAFRYQQTYEIVDRGDRCTLTWTGRIRGFYGLLSAYSRAMFGTDDEGRATLNRIKEAVEAS